MNVLCVNCKNLYKSKGQMVDANSWALLTSGSLFWGGQETMRSQYRPAIWSQCLGSYWVINSQSWSGTSGHRSDHARWADKDEESSTWHILSGHGAGASQHGMGQVMPASLAL